MEDAILHDRSVGKSVGSLFWRWSTLCFFLKLFLCRCTTPVIGLISNIFLRIGLCELRLHFSGRGYNARIETVVVGSGALAAEARSRSTKLWNSGLMDNASPSVDAEGLQQRLAAQLQLRQPQQQQ